jgi:hypothetical protein
VSTHIFAVEGGSLTVSNFGRMFFVCVLILVFSTTYGSGRLKSISSIYFPVFRGIFYVGFFFCLYGTTVFIWKRHVIHYQSLLNVTYAHTHQYVLQGSASLSHMIFTCYCLFMVVIVISDSANSTRPRAYQHIFPIGAVLLPILVFFCPSDRLTYMFFGVVKNGFIQRWHLVQEGIYCLGAPFTETTFLRSLIADVLTSMPRAYQDFQYTICLYSTAAYFSFRGVSSYELSFEMGAQTCSDSQSVCYFILACALQLLPFYIRFWQCVRLMQDNKGTPSAHTHMLNGVKYVLCFALALVSKLVHAYGNSSYFLIIWLVLGAGTTIYVVYWDVVVDWGLFSNSLSPPPQAGSNSVSHKYLRPILLYHPFYYYAAIISNAVFRLGWAIVVSPGQPFLSQQYVLLLGVLELFRRAVWICLRVEYEQVKRLQRERR